MLIVSFYLPRINLVAAAALIASHSSRIVHVGRKVGDKTWRALKISARRPRASHIAASSLLASSFPDADPREYAINERECRRGRLNAGKRLLAE